MEELNWRFGCCQFYDVTSVYLSLYPCNMIWFTIVADDDDDDGEGVATIATTTTIPQCLSFFPLSLSPHHNIVQYIE